MTDPKVNLSPLATAPLPTEAERRALWLAERSKCLTGTDAGRILSGMGLDVWLEKMGHHERDLDEVLPDFVQAGRYYERGTLAWYADLEGAAIRFADSYTFIRHPFGGLPIGCTLDARRLDDGRPVDAKMIHRWQAHDPATGTGWGDSGSSLVPTTYAAQMAVQMACLGAERGDFPVFFRVDGEFAIFRLERDAKQEERLLTFLADWHQRYIVRGERPPVGPTETATKFLASIERKSDRLRPANENEGEVGRRLALIKIAKKAIETEHTRLTNMLRDAVGHDLGITGDGWKFTHKANAPSVKQDDDKIIADLMKALTAAIGPERAAAAYSEALDRHSREVPGPRVARLHHTIPLDHFDLSPLQLLALPLPSPE